MSTIVHNGARWWDQFAPLDNGDIATLLEALRRYFDDLAEGEGGEPVRAVAFWRDILFRVPEVQDEQASELLGALREEAARAAGREAQARGERDSGRAPRRVFVSHRQQDASQADALAREIIKDGRFDVWLDIWDPALAAVTFAAMPPHTKALLAALIIEMGLVNAVAVVALMTSRAAGSLWIPYEFGRVKTGGPFAQMAAGCRDGLNRGDLPEYMLLGDDISRSVGGVSYPGLTDWLDKL